MSKESKAYKNLPKKIYIRTFGCQMNVRDSEVICGLLRNAGYELAVNPDEADVVILNTCSVRQHAEEKVWSEIGRYKKGQAPKIIGIVGCMAQNYKEKIFERSPGVDFVVGPSDIHKIPGIIDKLLVSRKKGTVPCLGGRQAFGDSSFLERKIWETDGDIRPEEIYHSGFYEDKNHAYVVISEGCSNFCSYCIVPYVRGPLRNRKPDDILKEIEEAVHHGITKIILLGQNVNAYQFRGLSGRQAESRVSFIELLGKVNAVKGLKEFSFITSHPKDTSLELFKTMAGCQKLKKYLHLPVQSGSDKILKAMNRGYSRKYYLDLAHNYRKIIKKGALTTDIIVGFPKETEADFKGTYDLVKDIGFNAAFIFKYSPRPNTEAKKLDDDVPKQEKERRHALILELQKKISNKVKRLNVSALAEKFLILLFIFSFFIFNFTSSCYAFDLTGLKVEFLKGDYKTVITEGEKIMAGAAADSRGLDELYYILALSYLKEGNALRASDIFEIILSEFKNTPFKEQALLGLGDACFMREDYPKAREYYLKLTEDSRAKFRSQAYYRLARCDFRLGNSQQAQGYLNKIKEEYPLNLEVEANKDLALLPQIYYTVQVGVFVSAINAKNLTQKLILDGYPAYTQDSLSGYRVRVGRLPSLKEAQGLEAKLSKEGYPTKIFP